ncbi:MAG: ABC transporter ATP-binding protein [Acidimicrobiia bacterium]|nr:ABC transporter ATP-binding protein [Acidimicrobiia bacterium]
MNATDRSGGEGLAVRGLSVSLEGHKILRDLQLSVRRGEILALLGPSGCGKTTLLRTIAGLQAPAGGSVSWAGEDQRSVPAHRRRFGMVFQDHALLPHRNVGANVAFGLRMQKIPAPERRRRVAEMLQMVGLEGYDRRSVATLSGGEAQRVALARALVTEPKLLLADEPFAALDRPLHDRLLADVRRILTELHQTAIHVTHDHTEAFALADRVALMRDGRIHRTATPQQLRDDPQDAWTATFLGLGTIWQPAPAGGVTATGELRTPWGALILPAPTAAGVGNAARELCLLIRPQAVELHRPDGVSAIISDVRVVGDRTVATFQVTSAPPVDGYVAAGATPGQTATITLDPTGVTLLSPE